MSKLSLSNVGDLINTTTAATTINQNNANIVSAMENTLSRDGTSPNEMQSTLDMNSYQIVNLPTPATNESPLRLVDLTEFNGGGTITNIPTGGSINQVLSKKTSADFDIQWSNSVTSVGLSLPSDFSISGSPVTTTGTLTAVWLLTPTGNGAMVKATSPTLTTPTITNPTVTTGTFTSPTMVTPTLGAATATSINGIGIAGTNGTTMTFPGTSTTVAGLGVPNAFTQTISITASSPLNVNGSPVTFKTTTVGGDIAAVRYNTNTTSETVGFGFQDGGNTKFTFAKVSDNSLRINDFVNSVDMLVFNAGTTSTGYIKHNNTTPATSATTGSIVTSGGIGAAGAIWAGTYVATTPTTVASLPAAAAGNKGARMFVTDANATFTAGIGAVVVGGGANNVPVTSDGTNWRIG